MGCCFVACAPRNESAEQLDVSWRFWDGQPMIAPLRPGVTLPQTDGPIIETERLVLRRWREADIEPNTAMLGDPASARFITSDGKPVTDSFVGWRNAAIMAGHWALHGVGMFVVEEKQTNRFAGRVGPFQPSGSGRVLKSAGVSPAAFAARVTRSRPRGLRSTGPLQISRLIRSFTASTAKMSHHKAWRSGSGPPLNARSICSAMSPTYG